MFFLWYLTGVGWLLFKSFLSYEAAPSQSLGQKEQAFVGGFFVCASWHFGLLVLPIPSPGYIKQTNNIPKDSSLSKVPSQFTFCSPPFRVFFSLFYVYCPEFLSVLSDRSKKKYLARNEFYMHDNAFLEGERAHTGLGIKPHLGTDAVLATFPKL